MNARVLRFCSIYCFHRKKKTHNSNFIVHFFVFFFGFLHTFNPSAHKRHIHFNSGVTSQQTQSFFFGKQTEKNTPMQILQANGKKLIDGMRNHVYSYILSFLSYVLQYFTKFPKYRTDFYEIFRHIPFNSIEFQ